MTHPNTPAQAMNNAAQEVVHPGLSQLVDAISSILAQNNETFRVRVNMFKDCEVVKFTSMSTDHQLRFSVITKSPTNIHMGCMQFLSVFQNERHAGWSTPVTSDIRTQENYELSKTALLDIQKRACDWLLLNQSNARSPRTRFLAIDKSDKAPNKMVAASFEVTNVRVVSGETFTIELTNPSLGCMVTLDPETSARFKSPTSMVGSRVIVHDSGVIRVLKSRAFSALYALTNH